MSAYVRSTLVVLLSFAAIGTAGAATTGAPMLYAQRCASCHGAIGQGSPVAPPLIGTPAVYVHFMLDTGRMPAGEPGINEIHKTPAFTEQQIDDLVSYVEGFTRRPDLRMPVLGPANIVHGRTLFDENCQECHGAVGNGASVAGDNVAPSLMNATVFQVAEAIRSGPGIMPRFGRGDLSAQDVSDIARYVNFMQVEQNAQQEDAGGIGLAHIGPVAEGLVAWIFGIGALLVFLRSIGSSQ
ncbi:MAG: c-type cytochrome [Candidatus Tyrphobacter sp.]